MSWKVRAIRGATTVAQDNPDAIADAVNELLEKIQEMNSDLLVPQEIVNVIFSVTQDIKKAFPAATARKRKGWENAPLLDVQQMHVEGALPKCIRCWIQFNTEDAQTKVHHVYLRDAKHLRPDLIDDTRP